MACVIPIGTPQPGEGAPDGWYWTFNLHQGWILRERRHYSPHTAAQKNLVRIIRFLAREVWPSLTPAEKAAWANPADNAARTRSPSIVATGNPWQCFVNAHVGEIWHRGAYVPSDPTATPNDTALLQDLAIDWTAQTIDVWIGTFWHSGPDAADVIETYQIDPRYWDGTFRFERTRHMSGLVNLAPPVDYYHLQAPFRFPVAPGQSLVLWGRFRSTGGFGGGYTLQVER